MSGGGFLWEPTKSTLRAWQLEVPNGQYTVVIAAGDPGNSNGAYAVTAEGQLVVGFPTTADERTKIDSTAVEVSDGRLTLGHGDGAAYNRICSVIARPVGGPPEKGFRFLSPSGEAQVALGDEMTISWVAATSVGTAIPSISVDDGRNWVEIATSSIDRGTNEWGFFTWRPDSVIVINVKLVDASGKVVLRTGGDASGSRTVGLSRFAPGVYIARIDSGRKARNYRFALP